MDDKALEAAKRHRCSDADDSDFCLVVREMIKQEARAEKAESEVKRLKVEGSPFFPPYFATSQRCEKAEAQVASLAKALRGIMEVDLIDVAGRAAAMSHARAALASLEAPKAEPEGHA